jgi:hypothetical protein
VAYDCRAVQGDVFKVVGEGNVTVYSVPHAVAAFEPGQRQSVVGARVSLLHSGQGLNWQQLVAGAGAKL